MAMETQIGENGIVAAGSVVAQHIRALTEVIRTGPHRHANA